MSFGQRMRERREAMGLGRDQLADLVGVTRSAIGNYETGVSFPKEDVLLRLLHALRVDPNYLYQDDFHGEAFRCSAEEQSLVEQYRQLTLTGRQAVRAVLGALQAYQSDLERAAAPEAVREIPLYRYPAAAGFPAPVPGEDYDLIPVTGEVPRGAEFAVGIQGDSMEPYISDGGVVYVNRDPLENGDVGIFFLDGDMLCKQYCRDREGNVHLFSLNRSRADADRHIPAESGSTLCCYGRVILPQVPAPPLPEQSRGIL